MARCLIVEDEFLAREKLRGILAASGLFEVMSEAGTLAEARSSADAHPPDAIFLDVRLPDGTGFDLLRDRELPPILVFTTALDQFAVTAFELQALDYLVKPFTAERIAQTLARVRTALGAPAPDLRRRITAAFDRHAPAVIMVRVGDGLKALRTDEIEWIEGVDDHAGLWTAERRYLLFRRLTELEAVLAPIGFLRVHRSHLVNLHRVDRVLPLDDGRADVVLRSGRRVACSRARAPRLREALSV